MGSDFPVVIGGVGGSGTRVVAQLLRDAGFYIGSDLNAANDNLWFTLVFVRTDILVEPRVTFDEWASLFYRRMTAGTEWVCDDDVRAKVLSLAGMRRALPAYDWFAQRAASFLAPGDHRVNRWGWKEPNSHVVVDRLLEFDPTLRYIHVTRNGLDMAFSANQNQLQRWGSVFLGRDVENDARESLAYWCAVHRRMEAIAGAFPDRVKFVDFEQLCAAPRTVACGVLDFVRTSAPEQLIEDFASRVTRPESMGRFRNRDLSDLSESDISYVAQWGYPVS